MTIEVEEMRRQLIAEINYAADDELIALYERMRGVKVENVGDDYFPCYTVTPKDAG
jgi:hypothetical protein